MKALIFAAGRGERLKPITDRTPKPLVKVNNLPLIHHHLLALIKAGVDEVVINVSWLKEQIINYINGNDFGHLTIHFSVEADEPLETGGGMLQALPMLGPDPFIVVNADIYTDFDFSTLRHLPPNHLVHLILVDNPDHNPNGDFTVHNQQLKTKSSTAVNYTYAGIGLYHPHILQPPFPDEKFSIVPSIHAAISTARATAQVHHGYWHDVGTIERLNELTGL